MKKVLFVAIIATLIAVGCEKTEIINPNLGTEILFSPELGKLTKADEVAKDATLKTQGFKVSAINAYEDLYTTDIEFNSVYREMNNLQFIYGTNGWALQNGQSYFWPGTGKDLVFLAVSSKTTGVVIPAIPDPEEATEEDFGISGTPVKDANEKPTGAYSGITVNNFTIPDFTVTPPSYVKEAGENLGDQTGADDDLMVANVVIQNQDDYQEDVVVKGQVKLDFRHTLSKVQFVFTTNTTTDYPVTVNKVEIKDVINKATLGVGVSFAEGSRTSTNTYDWSPSGTDNDVYYFAEKNATTPNYTDFVIDYNLSLDATQELPYATWLVIPQSLEGKMVSITYTIADNNNKDAGGIAATSQFTSVFPLYTSTLTAWSRNQYVRYKINLSPNLITFNPVVTEDWSTNTDVEHNN